MPAQQIGDALLQVQISAPVLDTCKWRRQHVTRKHQRGTATTRLRSCVALHGEHTQENDLITERTMAPTVMANASIFSILNPPPRCTGAPFDPCMNFAVVRLHDTATKWRHKRLKKQAQGSCGRGTRTGRPQASHPGESASATSTISSALGSMTARDAAEAACPVMLSG